MVLMDKDMLLYGKERFYTLYKNLKEDDRNRDSPKL